MRNVGLFSPLVSVVILNTRIFYFLDLFFKPDIKEGTFVFLNLEHVAYF